MDENEQVIEETPEVDEVEELLAEETDDTPEPKVEKPKETPEAKKSRLERELKQLNKKLGVKDEPVPSKQKTGELDDVESLLLEVKGIQDQSEIDLYEQWKTDTGRSGRQILNNSIFQKELEVLRETRAVKDATPSGTRRSTNGSPDSVAAAVAKFEKTKELPTDFELRLKVVDALAAKSNTNKPAWHS